MDIASRHGATVRLRPFDLGGRVFPLSGGLPLSKRAPQRQAYRLLELQRYSDHLQVPIHRQPRFFPVAGDDAAQLIIAVDQQDGTPAALEFTLRVLRCVWWEQGNIADEQVLQSLLKAQGLPTSRVEDAHSQGVAEVYAQYTQEAIDAGVFGAPSYVVDGEIFWGQDRLDFLERRLAAPTPTVTPHA
jgi:carboxymethylenebutenolidase